MNKKVFSLLQFLFFIVQFFLCNNSFANISNHAILVGVIKGNKGEGITLYRADETSELLNYSNSQYIPTDSTGHFYINIILDKADYYDIGSNTLFISPNDSINMVIDIEDPSISKFSGDGADIQKYLSGNPYYKSASYLEGGKNIRRKLEENLEFILSQEQKRNVELGKLTNVSKSFNYMETARIKADVIISLVHLRSYYKRMFGIKQGLDSIPELKNYHSTAIPIIEQYAYNFTDKKYLALINYRYILSTIIKFNTENRKLKPIIQWSKFSQLSSEIDQAMKTNDVVLLNKLKKDIIGMPNEDYRNAVLNKLSTVSNLIKGMKAVDFDFEDSDGNKRKLSDYKGKSIFIDLWATWCEPCLVQKPDFEKLSKKYKDKGIFLSISLDSDKKRWLTFLKNKEISVIEGWSSFKSLSMYNVVSIPRYIIIDEDFNVFILDAPNSSSKIIQDYFNAL
ncbi:hypothetical protein KO02_15730 [Sphingobacterium sp. ML3W]|uniref:TlpA family protein disulfide reductase n=1 Tax=Sphingobacterium sp. ML3W TaxID=1538644 RepID=UPI0004F6B7D2|nr:TlpA disulfide reductase family protein [Sphingobacterium sp. ML3W]AIM37974.1 hypothetical protein KO02_15730 [Sphingobacterium sp. ML3W]